MGRRGGSGEGSTGRGARLRSLLPRGGALPDDVWRSRHRGVLALLWLHLPALFVFALVRGNSWTHALVEAKPVKGKELERVLKRWLPARGSRSVGAGP